MGHKTPKTRRLLGALWRSALHHESCEQAAWRFTPEEASLPGAFLLEAGQGDAWK